MLELTIKYLFRTVVLIITSDVLTLHILIEEVEKPLASGQASYIFLGLSFLCLTLQDWTTAGLFNISIIDIWGWIVIC